MPSFQRLLLFSPLIALTLFFSACGWRSWHLTNQEEEIWLAIPAYYLHRQDALTPLSGRMTIFLKSPFKAHHLWVLYEQKKRGANCTPLPKSVIQKLRQRYHQLSLGNHPKENEDFSNFTFGQVRLHNKFTATCPVSYEVQNSTTKGALTLDGTLTLRRSFLPFADNNWYVANERIEDYITFYVTS